MELIKCPLCGASESVKLNGDFLPAVFEIQKDEEAFKWYKLAADKHVPPKVLLIVGRLYQQGKGCTKSYDEALNIIKDWAI